MARSRCRVRRAKFRFRLKAANGEVIAVGKAYETKASAKNGIASLQRTPQTPRWST
jgi:uncharacterized protein YegP (UPF0339 family)